MFGLVAASIGVGLATVGVFLFFSNRFKGNRGLGGELFAITLLLGGGALLLSSVTLNFDDTNSLAAGFDANKLLEQYPTAAGGAPLGGIADTRSTPRAWLPHKKVIVLAWGTPSDMDTADSNRIESYSLELQQLARTLLQDYAQEAEITTYTLTREEYRQLSRTPLVLTGWCERYQAELLLAVGMGTVQVSNGDYALWREPVYEALDCQTQQAARRFGKINERPGDRFPYQLALQTDLAELLEGFTVTR